MLDLLVSVCTRSTGYFSVNIFNESKRSQIINQKLPMVVVRKVLYNVVTWDEQVMKDRDVVNMVTLQD